MEEITWELSNGLPAPEKVEKLPFLAPLTITADMSQGQKEFALNYNTMQAMLIQYKLMKTK